MCAGCERKCEERSSERGDDERPNAQGFWREPKILVAWVGQNPVKACLLTIVSKSANGKEELDDFSASTRFSPSVWDCLLLTATPQLTERAKPDARAPGCDDSERGRQARSRPINCRRTSLPRQSPSAAFATHGHRERAVGIGAFFGCCWLRAFPRAWKTGRSALRSGAGCKG